MSTLTFFRIKEGIKDPDDIIVDRNSSRVHHRPVAVGRQRVGDLYLRRIERAKPSWLGYLAESVDLEGVPLKTASIAAVLLVKSGKELFAVIFGHGASMVCEGVVDAAAAFDGHVSPEINEEARSRLPAEMLEILEAFEAKYPSRHRQ